jgi:hypothetical protein
MMTLKQIKMFQGVLSKFGPAGYATIGPHLEEILKLAECALKARNLLNPRKLRDFK